MNILLNAIAALLIFTVILIITLVPFILNKEEEQDLKDRKGSTK
jgi:cytochrome c oxidase assembly factor CtaG